MNNLNCILNTNTIMEAVVIGFITFIIGHIAFNLTINKKNKDEKNKPYGLGITFFITGFLLHFIIEIIGLNKWYCDKKCMSAIRNIAKL